ncbi:PqqD family protein [Paenactinomyces guangxiensis]|uniref:PqqD family protein n=2 Tax=Paenactinomyces guangxiensis TaxID=1490290 RepID=A0A7W1WPP1_9BACL|nr:PqqD family protein [Paenactinomyces guangxiensis]MBH8591013.1 PqqD family protein [Paenactinomyces guangxiensis]
MIPALKPSLTLESNPDNPELLQLVIPRTSLLEKFSVRFLKQPPYLRIRLDRLGSFVLARCNGKHQVEQIQQQVAERFGEEAEPVLPRLLKFLEMVEANGWINWK